MSHKCHAHGCEREIPPRLFMCLAHWRALPRPVQRAIWYEYRPGQERDKGPSLRYLAVQQYAVGLSAFRPRDEEAARVTAVYVARALAYQKRCIDEGAGDPLHDILKERPGA